MNFVGIENTFCRSGTREEILNKFGLNINVIQENVKKLINS